MPTDRSDLPKTIKIGIYNYKLVEMSEEKSSELEADGLCELHDLEIMVLDNLPDQHFAQVLEHEINHACWHMAGLKAREKEESVVRCLTQIQIMARRDNPEIYRWIDEVMR